MAIVYIGSAHGDERGKAYGGQAGDQTTREVSAEVWYKHSKGWRVFRCKDPQKAAMIAECMRAACDNDYIGYDQFERNTLYVAAKPYGFDVSKVAVNVETDCSALVRVCCAYAEIMLGDFNTMTQPRVLEASGEFIELTGSEYTARADNLKKGDILVTASRGHTVVVLNDGSTAEYTQLKKKATTTLLRNGMKGTAVKELQIALISLGYSCGVWGADGDFGDGTELAVRSFQRKNGLEVDGIVGAQTMAAIDAQIGKEEREADEPNYVEFTGNCYIRSTSNASGEIYGVAIKGTKLPYENETTNGWHKIMYGNRTAWVSATYGKLIKD